MTRIVRSLLENDLYTFTMMQQALHKHPALHAVFEFICRNTPAYPLAELLDDVNAELDHLCSLQFEDDEIEWLRTKPYLSEDFIEFLSLFRYRRKFITAHVEGQHLRIRAAGPRLHVMGFEIVVLYIVSELYMRRLNPEAAFAEGIARTQAKIGAIKAFGNQATLRHPFEFFDFGLRRRHSAAMQDAVVDMLAREVPQFFKGTSNCYLAKWHGLVVIGTMSHALLMAYQQSPRVRLRDFQKAALEDWSTEFKGELGIALTDTVGTDAFLDDFSRDLALAFDGVRHDSGDPYVWGEKMLAKYRELRIDANGKRLVFSNSLDFPAAFSLYQRFGDRAMNGYGIGTHLTNDTGVAPLNIVMKLVECNGGPVAKLSDDPGKVMCRDPEFLAYLRKVFNKFD